MRFIYLMESLIMAARILSERDRPESFQGDETQQLHLFCSVILDGSKPLTLPSPMLSDQNMRQIRYQ